MLQIYYGNGKGKTTACIGAAVRAAGHNYKVLIAQFLKCENSGERKVLSKIDNITLLPCPVKMDFVFNLSESQKAQISKLCMDIFNTAVNTALTQKYDMVIFDELLTAIDLNIMPESEVYSLLTNAPHNIEIICTGNNATEKIIEIADYVSKVVKIKHPYDNGIEARSGIEF